MRNVILWLLAKVAILGHASPIFAHEFQPGYLELREVADGRFEVFWRQPAIGQTTFGLVPVLPAACTLGDGLDSQFTPGALVVRAVITCPDGLRGQTVAVPGLEFAAIDVLVRLHHRDGTTQTHLLRPTETEVRIGATPDPWDRTWAYFRLGIEHILLGVDHLLFVLGLLLLVPNRPMLVKTITAFTVAHSLILAAATLGYASAPMRPLNAAIALSILFLGPEIVRTWRGQSSLTIRHPWAVAFAFGLLHGFGFATGLTTMGLPAGELPWALLLFNVGVEAGQLLFVALILGLARAFRTLEIQWPLVVERLPGYAIGSLGAFWTIQRTLMLVGGR